MIGSVYGAHLGAAGHTVSVLSPPPRTADVAVRGLAALDVLTGSRAETGVHVVPDPAAGSYDLVLAAVRSDQLALAYAQLISLPARRPCCFSATTLAAGPQSPPTSPARSS